MEGFGPVFQSRLQIEGIFRIDTSLERAIGVVAFLAHLVTLGSVSLSRRLDFSTLEIKHFFLVNFTVVAAWSVARLATYPGKLGCRIHALEPAIFAEAGGMAFQALFRPLVLSGVRAALSWRLIFCLRRALSTDLPWALRCQSANSALDNPRKPCCQHSLLSRCGSGCQNRQAECRKQNIFHIRMSLLQ